MEKFPPPLEKKKFFTGDNYKSHGVGLGVGLCWSSSERWVQLAQRRIGRSFLAFFFGGGEE